jgi:hypothetical protein
MHRICFYESHGHTLLQLLWNGFIPISYLQILTYILLFMLPLHYVYTLACSAAFAIKPIRSMLLYYAAPKAVIAVAVKSVLDAHKRLQTVQTGLADAHGKRAAAACDTAAALKARQAADARKQEDEETARRHKEELARMQESLDMNEASSAQAMLQAEQKTAELKAKLEETTIDAKAQELLYDMAAQKEAEAIQNVKETEKRIQESEYNLEQTKDKLKLAEQQNEGLLQLLHSTLDPLIPFGDVRFDEAKDTGYLASLGEGAAAKVIKGEYTHGRVAIKVRHFYP